MAIVSPRCDGPAGTSSEVVALVATQIRSESFRVTVSALIAEPTLGSTDRQLGPFVQVFRVFTSPVRHSENPPASSRLARWGQERIG